MMLRIYVIILLIFSLFLPLSALPNRHILSATGTTPVSFRIPIPTFGISYDILIAEHILLGIGLSGSSALFPLNGLDGGSSHGSVSASAAVLFGRFTLGTRYFTQANSFRFTAYTNDSSQSKLGTINHTGRQDYVIIFFSVKLTEKLTVFGGPGFELIRNNTYRNDPEANLNSSQAIQWQDKISEYEADYHNFLDRYKVYLGISVALFER